MAVQQQLGNDRTTVYQDGLDVVFERVFDAPRDLVWKVYTEPDRIRRTFGVVGADFAPGNETMTLEDLGDGRTKLTERGHFGSQADIDFQVGVGMIEGALGQYDRLADEIARG